MLTMRQKFNRKFNNRRIRFAGSTQRWHRIGVILSDAEGLTSPFNYEKASPEEVRCMAANSHEIMRMSGDCRVHA